MDYIYKLDWNYHIDIVRNKVAKNVGQALTSFALYSQYRSLVMPCLTYCCEVWGNKYKTRIQSLFIVQNRANIICLNTIITNAIPNHCFANLDHFMFFYIIDLNSFVFM